MHRPRKITSWPDAGGAVRSVNLPPSRFCYILSTSFADMPFDPALPIDASTVEAAELRSQFTGLKTLVDAGAVTAAQTQNTGTLSPGTPATADVALNAGTLTFTFGIPAGTPGEVTQAQLSNDLVNTQNAAVNTALPLTSANTNGVGLLSLTSGDFAVQSLIDKMNELLTALRR